MLYVIKTVQSRNPVLFAGRLHRICGTWKPRWAGTKHTLSSPARQGSCVWCSCSPGRVKLHNMHFHLRVSTGHANLDNFTATIFSPCKPTTIFLTKFSSGLESSKIFLNRGQGLLYCPLCLSNIYLCYCKENITLIPIYTFKYLCVPQVEMLHNLSINSFLGNLFPPKSQVQRNNWQIFLFYLSMIRHY